MLAKRYTGKKLVDNIFATSKKAKQAIAKFGKENVINATIGSNISIEGYGEQNPADTYQTAAGRSKNRRVEFIISRG